MVGGASILYLMGELALFAKGRAKRELLNVFNLKETEQVSDFMVLVRKEMFLCTWDFTLSCTLMYNGGHMCQTSTKYLMRSAL